MNMPCSDFTNPGNFPRSPRETLGGYVIAARTLDKCRASLAGTLGEYKFDCPLDNFLFGFTNSVHSLMGHNFLVFAAAFAFLSFPGELFFSPGLTHG